MSARIVTKPRESVNSAWRLVALLVCALVPTAARSAPVRSLEVLAIRAEFPDRSLTVDRARYLAEPDGVLPRFERYWTEVSAGRIAVHVHLGEPVVRLSRPRVAYVQRPQALAIEAIAAFRRDATSPADVAALGTSEQAIVFFAGNGRESHVGRPPNDPWSNYVSLASGLGAIRGASVIAETEIDPFSSFGVLCHEFGHQLGLPELYAPGGAAHEGIGVWGLMGQGTWIDRGRHPPHPCAWSKLRLGWVDPRVITKTTWGIALAPITEEPVVVKIPLPGAPPKEYLLIEHRARRGADAWLPGEGLLVWHVDERRESFRGAQADPAHKMVHLVDADGRDDLDRGHAHGGNRGDAGDPWTPPSAARRRVGTIAAVVGALLAGAAVLRLGCAFWAAAVLVRAALGGALLWVATLLLAAPVCGPSRRDMRPYDGGPGRVVIRNLRRAGDRIIFDVVVLPGAPPDEPVAGTQNG
jgi:immune inhibitor A